MRIDPNPSAAKSDPFQLEPEALLASLLPRKGDPTARRDDAVPGESIISVQRPHRESGRSREANGCRRLTVRDHPTAGDPGDHVPDPPEHRWFLRHGGEPVRGVIMVTP